MQTYKEPNVPVCHRNDACIKAVLLYILVSTKLRIHKYILTSARLFKQENIRGRGFQTEHLELDCSGQ